VRRSATQKCTRRGRTFVLAVDSGQLRGGTERAPIEGHAASFNISNQRSRRPLRLPERREDRADDGTDAADRQPGPRDRQKDPLRRTSTCGRGRSSTSLPARQPRIRS
jgi:hypothetical protein